MNTYTAQVGLKRQAAETVEETLVAADFSGNRKETNHSYGVGQYERALQRGTATKQPPLSSMYTNKVSFTEEVAGGAAATEAPWGVTLGGMGFTSILIKQFTIGTITGTTKIGDVITAPGSKSGICVGYDAGGLKVWLMTTGTAFANTDVCTNATRTGGFVLGSAGTTAGRVYKPLSEVFDGAAEILPPILTLERRLGGQRHTCINARGSGGITLKQGQPALINAEFTGLPVFSGAGLRTPRTGAPLTGIPIISSPPKVAQGVLLEVEIPGSSAYTPILTEMSIDFGIQLAPRATMTDGAIGETGYVSTRITDRGPTGRIDPEHILAAGGFDFISAVLSNDAFRMRCQLGARTDTFGALVMYSPTVRGTGDYEPGDRDNIVTSPINLGFYGDADDELLIAHVFQV